MLLTPSKSNHQPVSECFPQLELDWTCGIRDAQGISLQLTSRNHIEVKNSQTLMTQNNIGQRGLKSFKQEGRI